MREKKLMRISLLLLVFMLAFSTSAFASPEGNFQTFNEAPDTVYWSAAIFSSISHEFYSVQHQGHNYRGYLIRGRALGGGYYQYDGTLYRAPLDYPIPF